MCHTHTHTERERERERQQIGVLVAHRGPFCVRDSAVAMPVALLFLRCAMIGTRRGFLAFVTSVRDTIARIQT